MNENVKAMPFPVFQNHCGERKFLYAGKPGFFRVACRMNNDQLKCNDKCCPIWNSDKVFPCSLETEPKNPKDLRVQSLRDINLALKGNSNAE